MRKGFSYINLLVYCGLFLLLFGVLAGLFYPLLKKTSIFMNEINDKTELTQVVDQLVEDITYADTAAIYGQTIAYEEKGISYEYSLKNRRLVRKKEGYVYLTPKELVITEFTPRWVKPGFFELKIKANTEEIIRLIRRRN